MHRLVRHLDMQRVAVGVRIDRDRRDSQLSRGLDDPAGDLATIGDQDALEHARLNPCPGLLALRRCSTKVNRRALRIADKNFLPDAGGRGKSFCGLQRR
jgi:hypothetical protein